MAQLIYSQLTSLDGYVVDADGNFDWAAPDEMLHQFFNDFERTIGTHLYGRRLYETMRYWETADDDPDQSPVERDYTEVWRNADKIVFSQTLTAVDTSRTELRGRFDPAEIRRLKDEATADLSIGGPTLAAYAIRAGLIDEFHQFVNPVIVGGGTPWLPAGIRLDLELIEESRFDSGVVQLRCRPRR